MQIDYQTCTYNTSQRTLNYCQHFARITLPDLPLRVVKLEEAADSAVLRADNGQPITVMPISLVMMGTPLFTPCLVHKELSTLDITKSPGPDQLHP